MATTEADKTPAKNTKMNKFTFRVQFENPLFSILLLSSLISSSEEEDEGSGCTFTFMICHKVRGNILDSKVLGKTFLGKKDVSKFHVNVDVAYRLRMSVVNGQLSHYWGNGTDAIQVK